jgi:hypothetical protein
MFSDDVSISIISTRGPLLVGYLHFEEDLPSGARPETWGKRIYDVTLLYFRRDDMLLPRHAPRVYSCYTLCTVPSYSIFLSNF